jgi:glycosyltransferase involved in cell wall biosynthesis
MKIVYLTAGAAGMFCGSCMHDNTLARALAKLGHDVQLIPLYTPIRTDESSFAKHQIFFGGINVYLQQYFPPFRWLPRWLTRPLDQEWLINWASQRSVKIKAAELGGITISMLKGEHGPLRSETERLVEWLVEESPDIVVFTNILVAASLPAIRARLPKTRLIVTLQGDDIFINDLLPKYREQALGLIQRLAEPVDAFITNSRYYADYMSDLLQLPPEKFRVVPLGLDTTDFESLPPATADDRPPTIGFLARLAPEKGLHVLADAFILLRKMPGCENVRLRLAGWLGKQHQPYVDENLQKFSQNGDKDAVEILPDVDRHGKLDFLQSIDVLSVPTVYREPKGLFVLESLAAGVPVVQPDHGAFPEVLNDLQGGLLVPPDNPQALAEALSQLISNPSLRKELAKRGQANVLSRRNAHAMAEATLQAML